MSWSSFLNACLNASLLSHETLHKTFTFLDTNQQGDLTRLDLKNSMLRRGHSFSGHEVQVDKVIEETGIEGDIDFKKFC